MRRWFVAILGLLVLLSGCGRPAEPSIVLLDQPIESCERSLGGRFIAVGFTTFFDMQTRTVVEHPVPVTIHDYLSTWINDELMLYWPHEAHTEGPMASNGYHVNPGGFLLDVATGIVTDVTALPQAAQDQLRIDVSAADQREYGPRLQRSPDGQYWTAFATISHYDPLTKRSGDAVIKSTIESVTECHRPWEPDSSGIIFLERYPQGLGFVSEPGPLRFLPVP